MKILIIYLLVLLSSLYSKSNEFELNILSTPKTDSIYLNSKFKGINANSFVLVPQYKLKKNSFELFSRTFIGTEKSEIDYLYIHYSLKNFNFKIGKFFRNISSEDSYRSSGSMIESNNSLKPWRINISFNIFKNKNISLLGDFSHGVLDRNSTYLKNPYLHEKSLYSSYKINNSKISLGIIHNTIWGGEVEGFGDLGGSLRDWLDVLIGDPGNEDKPDGEQVNSLGDAFGIIDFSFKQGIQKKYLKLYHQHFFEDNSGLKFKNWPDGLYGLEFSNSKFFFLAEYLNTKKQSGSIHPPGLDSYYWNMIYTAGWTYNNKTIGNPYINPYKNRIILKHYYFEKQFEEIFLSLKIINHKIFKSYNGTNNNQEFDLSNDLQESRSEYLVGLRREIQDINFSIFADLKSSDIVLNLNYTF
jgi:hypothetical protein